MEYKAANNYCDDWLNIEWNSCLVMSNHCESGWLVMVYKTRSYCPVCGHDTHLDHFAFRTSPANIWKFDDKSQGDISFNSAI